MCCTIDHLMTNNSVNLILLFASAPFRQVSVANSSGQGVSGIVCSVFVACEV